MNNNLPVTYQWQAGLPSTQIQSPRLNVPLGTAEWLHFPQGAVPHHRGGEFFVGLPLVGGSLGIADDSHIFLCSKTRGGKGTSIIIPNVLTWPGSVVVFDPKGETALVTARSRGNGSKYARKRGQKVRILDPFGIVKTEDDDFNDLRCRFNPLDVLRMSEHPVADAGFFADALITSESSSDRFWPDSAKGVVGILGLHVISDASIKDRDRNLITLRNLLVAGDADLLELAQLSFPAGEPLPSSLECLFMAFQRNSAFGGIIARAGRMYMDLYQSSPKTLHSIFSVAQTDTRFLDTPEIQNVISESDFALSELKENPAGTNLFLCLPHRYMPDQYRWLRLMLTLLVAEMERLPSNPKSGHPVLMVLDEFPSLGRLPLMEASASQLAGHGVRMLFVTQSIPALKKIYGDNFETFLANSATKLFFNVDDLTSRTYASKLIGECEVVRQTGSSSQTQGSSYSNASVSSQGFGGNKTEGWASSYSRTDSNATFTSSVTRGSSHSFSKSGSWNTGTSFTRTSGSSQSHTEGQSEVIHKRPLVTPDEVGRLFGNKESQLALVLVSGEQPIVVRRTSYFTNPSLKGRFDPHPDHPPPPTLVQIEEERLAAEREKQKLEDESALFRAMSASAEGIDALVRYAKDTEEWDRVYHARKKREEEERRKAEEQRFEEERKAHERQRLELARRNRIAGRLGLVLMIALATVLVISAMS